MVTKKGMRCSRNAAPGGFGFCWQHAPVRYEEQRKEWGQRFEYAKLVVTASAVLTQLAELAWHLYSWGIFPSSPPADLTPEDVELRRNLRNERYRSQRYQEIEKLQEMADNLQYRTPIVNEGHLYAAIEVLEREFDAWFTGLPANERQLLLRQVQRYNSP